jgi:hypothetical protein
MYVSTYNPRFLTIGCLCDSSCVQTCGFFGVDIYIFLVEYREGVILFNDTFRSAYLSTIRIQDGWTLPYIM